MFMTLRGWSLGMLVLLATLASWHLSGQRGAERERTAARVVAQSPQSSRPTSAVTRPERTDDVARMAGASWPRERAAAAPGYALSFASIYLPFLANGEPSNVLANFFYARIGDVTGDGRGDLVAMGYTESEGMLYVYAQRSDRTLAAPARYAFPDLHPVAGYLVGLGLEDMNADGVDDVVATYDSGMVFGLSTDDGSLRVVDASGSTATHHLMSSHVAAVLDLDGDGHMDIVRHLARDPLVTGGEAFPIDRRPRLRVSYGDGQGGFPAQADFAFYGDEPDPGEAVRVAHVEAIDLDGDGRRDLVMVSTQTTDDPWAPATTSATTWINDGEGALVATQVIALPVDSGRRLAVGDFNQDGRPDLGFPAMVGSARGVDIRYQLEDGRFSEMPVEVSLGGGWYDPGILAGDLDRDGRDDLLAGGVSGSRFDYFLGRDSAFVNGGYVAFHAIAGQPRQLTVYEEHMDTGDLDSDGCTDVAAALGENGLQVFRGSGCDRVRVTGGTNPPRRR